MTFPEIYAKAKPLLIALLIFAVGHFIIVFLVKGVKKALHRTKLDTLVADLLCKVLSIAMHIIVLLSALSALGVSTTGLLAALSAVGAGIALALKDSLSNIAGGIVLLTSPRFYAGDVIIFDDVEGEVISVDILHTTVLTYNKRQFSIPNGLLANGEIINLTREPFRRVDIDVPIPYDADVTRTKLLLLNVIDNNPKCVTDDEHIPAVRLSQYGDSALILATRAWCRTADYWPLYYELMEQYLSALNKAGLSVPFNHLDVTMVEEA